MGILTCEDWESVLQADATAYSPNASVDHYPDIEDNEAATYNFDDSSSDHTEEIGNFNT